MPIDQAQERLIIARLVLGITRAFSRQYYPGMGLARSLEAQSVAMGVFIGHVEDHPMTASALARFLEMPRPTVLRRLSDLMRLGYVARHGRRYCMVPDAVNGPLATATTRENVRRIMDATKELSKMDENR